MTLDNNKKCMSIYYRKIDNYSLFLYEFKTVYNYKKH